MSQSPTYQSFFKSVWILILLRGLAALFLGILLITRPGIAVIALVFWMGAYWLVDGVMTVITAIRGRTHADGWGWGLFFGAVSAVAGLFVMSAPALSAVFTATFLVYLLAFSAIVSGISEIVTGIRLRKEIDDEWAMLLGGGLWLLLGICLLSRPLLSAVVLVQIIAVFSIVGGIVLLGLAWKARSLGEAAAGAAGA